MNKLQTYMIDVGQEVYNNQTVAELFITHNFYGDTFIVSLPVESLSFYIYADNPEQDYQLFMQEKGISIDIKEKLVKVIRQVINDITG